MCRRYDFFIQPMQSTIQDPEALHKHPLITPEWVGHSSFTGLWKVCPLERSRPAANATREANGAVYGERLK
jgi:hypothetical protein